MRSKIKPITEVLEILSEHMERLRPENKPDYTAIGAAKVAAQVVDAYLNAVMTCMEYANRIGETPDFEFMEIGNGEVKEEHLSQPAAPLPEGSSAGRKKAAVAR